MHTIKYSSPGQSETVITIERIDGYEYHNGLCVGKHFVEVGRRNGPVRVWSKKLQNLSFIEERRYYWKNQSQLNWQKYHDELMQVIGTRSFIGKVEQADGKDHFIHVEYVPAGKNYYHSEDSGFCWGWCENPLPPHDDKYEYKDVPIDNESAKEFWRLRKCQDRAFKPFYLYDVCFRSIIDDNYSDEFAYHPNDYKKSALVLKINGREYIFSGQHKDAHGYSLGMLCESDEIAHINVP